MLLEKPKPKPRRKKPQQEGELGTFTFLLLCIMKTLPGEEWYAARLHEEINRYREPPITVAQVVVALKRLQIKGYVEYEEGRPVTGRGYKVKIYSITSEGERKFKEAIAFYKAIRSLIPED